MTRIVILQHPRPQDDELHRQPAATSTISRIFTAITRSLDRQVLRIIRKASPGSSVTRA